MKKLSASFLLLSLISCSFSGTGIKVEIINNSDERISDIEFTTSEHLEVVQLKAMSPKETVTEFLSMKKNEVDGNYILTFNRANGENEIMQAGYYSNGTPLNKKISYTIEKDSTSVEFTEIGFGR